MNFSRDSHGVQRSAVATDDVDHGQVTGNVNFGQIKAVRADKVLMLGDIKNTFHSHITVPVIEAVRLRGSTTTSTPQKTDWRRWL